MFALIYDNHHYQFAKVINTDKKASLIALLDSNLERKIKNEHLILSFAEDPQQFSPELPQAQAAIDIELLWELCQDNELWPLEELTNLNFGSVSTLHKVATFLVLADPAIWFSYHGNFQFKRLGREEVTMRQLQHKRHQEYQLQFDAIYTALLNWQAPSWSIDPITLINNPDKNSLEYKAVVKAAKELKLTIVELMFKLGYIASIEDYLETAFLREYFPQGTQLPAASINDHATELPAASHLTVFSIDDATTTEVDDAFSVQSTANGYIVGIHIAAPALNPELLLLASERLSTVYYPGHKITMLPENVIKHYSLDEGKQLPVVSIYFTLNQDLAIEATETRLEQVKIKANLRTESLEQLFNLDNLSQDHGYPFEAELKLLHNFATQLEAKRGRPSVNQLSMDYNFSFAASGKINIKPRLRGNPIDKLVSELMILANGSWGRILTNAFIPAIYRVKQPMQPVSMTLTPNSHTGLNVDYYTWASSPLRRAVDLVNQAQLISLIRGNKPLTATDPALAYVVTNFDPTYSAYLKFQERMERYWSLRYLEQEQISQIPATFIYRNNVQLVGVPLSIDLTGLVKPQPPGSQITLALSNFNFLNQTFEVKVISDC